MCNIAVAPLVGAWIEIKKDLSDCRKCKMNMLCSGKMTDREKEAFIGGIEFARDWNLDIPPDDLRLYERLIQERTKKENEQSHIDG